MEYDRFTGTIARDNYIMNQMTVEETKKIKRQAPNPPTNGVVQRGEENKEIKDFRGDLN